ncbi:methyl-accepting chemotaxis protein [uncultured Gammaproteobacteria bacterium]
MVNNLKLWTKIILAMGATVVVLTLALSVANMRIMSALIGEAERRELNDHVKAVTHALAAESRMAQGLSAFVAALPPVREKLAAGDRAALVGLLLPGYRVMAQQFGVEQFQFHTPLAVSFLRLHKPEKFGDDLSSFRRTVVNTNQTHKPTRGLESGVAGLGVRGVVPIEAEGQPLGSVEFGMAFGQEFFDSFKKTQKVELALHLVSGDKITTFASTIGKEPLSVSATILKAFQGEAQVTYLEIDGKPMAVYGEAVYDYSNAPIGVLEVAMDRSHYLSAMNEARSTFLWVGAAVLVAGMGLAFLTARHISRRIFGVKHAVEQVAEGNLVEDIAADGTDELGELANAASRMRAQLHDLAQKVRHHAHHVHVAACEITGAVGGQAATSSEMSASVAEITSTMEQLSASSAQIAEHSRAVVDIAAQTYENSKKGAGAMQAVSARMADIQRDNQNSLREILDLGSRSKEISKVMEIIKVLADQTKLIAFNAALEASSAGESGRRFGVVAAEIRRLADSVTDSTGDIETKISQIQDSIARLVVVSEKGASGIAFGSEAAAHTAGCLNELVGAARQTSSAAQQISLSTQQQRTASTQVVVALREIVTASSYTAQSIARISEISKDMALMAAALDELVNRFRLSVPSMAAVPV